MDEVLAKLVARAQEKVGTSLRGKYFLERLLGVGAMAAVFAATHRNGKLFAVKVLHPELAFASDLKARFLREGYIANRIQHPGVVAVIDDDEHEGEAFIVMELLDGHTLEREWTAAGRRLPLAYAVDIAARTLDVLDAAHAAGVVHRDVKPDNVFLTRAGPLKVLDFGIARLVDASSKTHSGQMMGTPEFVAPEQAAGLTREIDARTDVYSVGAMLFTLLSGVNVHVARTPMEAMIFAATKPARSILEVMPQLDPLVANAIDVSLSFDKNARWASAALMRDVLSRAKERLGPVTPPALERAAQDGPVAAGTGTVRVGSFHSEQPFPLQRVKPRDE